MKSKQLEKSENASIIEAGSSGLYKKLCDQFGREEVSMMKALLAPKFSEMQFVQVLYLARANNVHPLKNQCFFYLAKDKMTGGTTVVFMIGIDGFRARANGRLKLLEFSAVCENDDFEWDHVAGRPARHVSRAKDRGKVLAGWGRVQTAGMIKPISLNKIKAEWIKDTGAIFHETMSAHMMEVTIERNLYKVGTPDVLPGVSTPEEWGARIIGGKLSTDPDVDAEEEKDKDLPVAIPGDQRKVFEADVRVFMARLGLERNEARWDKIEKILGRKVPGKKLGNIPDWDLIRCHAALKEQANSKEGIKTVEVVEAIPEGVETQAADSEAKAEDTETKSENPKTPEKKDICETCHGEIPAVWGETLTRFKATLRECAPCYRTQHEEPVQISTSEEAPA